ncbi:MAG: peptidyl-prolyl cis-trans isomerase [Pseudomonadota bacterium]
MSSFVRKMSNSIAGKIVLVLFVVMIFASFALADMQSFSTGNFGMSSGALVKVGDEEVSDREVSSALQRRLTEVRQTDPSADYTTIAKDFDPLMDLLIQDAAIRAFAEDQGMTLSKRLVDAEIAKIPATKGLDGKFSQAAYQNFLNQQKLTDPDLRKILSGGLLQRLVLGSGAANGRVPVGMATPYASMLLEAREAEILLVPTANFLSGVPAPTDADITTYYRTNARAFTVPEQRVIDVARIGPAQVANVVPTDKEISDYYNANQATYGGTTRRVISQAVVPSKQVADGIAARARTGSFVDAASPAGFSAADISVGPQTRDQFTRLTGEQVAAATFSAASGAVVGPIQSDLGWHVVKVDSIQVEAGKTFAAARAEIVERLSVDKRKNALADLINRVEDSIADGSSFTDAVKAAGLTAVKSPPLLSNGTSRTDPAFKFPADLAPVLRAGFEMAQGDDPQVETLEGDAGYALVSVDQVTPAAPAPLASIRDRVAADWKNAQARAKARAVAAAIAAKVAKGATLQAASASSGVTLPAPNKAAIRRMQLAQMQGNVPPALNMMFALSQGGSRMIADPRGRGFIIIKLNRIIPGNALLQPDLVARTQAEFQQAVSGEYAEQMARAIQADLGVKRNEKAIADSRKRIIGS